jgi:hypothetical protein
MSYPKSKKTKNEKTQIIKMDEEFLFSSVTNKHCPTIHPQSNPESPSHVERNMMIDEVQNFDHSSNETDSIPSQKYTLEIDISQHPWILEIDESKRNESIQHFLHLGYMIHNMTQTNLKPDDFVKPIQNQIETKLEEMEYKNEIQMNVFHSRFEENLERVKSSLDRFTEFSHKSSFKGAMGENLVESIIQHYFPDDTIENTSKKTAESDYHMNCREGFQFLIESKFYSSVVNKQEVDKFKRDLSKSGYPVGILISLSSGIVGKKRFDIEHLNPHQSILYVPHAGLDGGPIIWSILFAKEFIRNKVHYRIENHTEDLSDLFDSFQEIYQHFASLKLHITESRSRIMTQMDDLFHRTIEIHYVIQELVSKMKNKIQNQIFLQNHRLQIDYPMNEHEETHFMETIFQQMENSQTDENEIILYRKLYDFSLQKGIRIEVDSQHCFIWYGYLNQDEIYRIKILSKKKELIISKLKIQMLFSMANLDLLDKIIS